MSHKETGEGEIFIEEEQIEEKDTFILNTLENAGIMKVKSKKLNLFIFGILR